MTPTPLVDPHGRTVRDLRLSVTDRCNLRCTYCMPEEGMPWLPRHEVLTFEEITRVARVCVERFGFGSLRLTGGEPTVRSGLVDLVAMLAELDVDLAMTTNGASLRLLAEPLRAAGLQRVNISLDTLDPDRFFAITRRDRLGEVLDGVAAAVEAGFDPVKVNCVLVRGVNDDEIVDLATWARGLGVGLRFIEWMPLDAQHEWGADRVVPAAEIVALLDAAFGIEPVAIAPGEGNSQPAERWRYRDGGGEVGVVASVTRNFCSTCDRIRLTADGQLRSCLFALREADLRPVLRGGGSDDDLVAAIAAEVGTKWAGHSIGQVQFLQPRRTMSQIGG